MELEEAKQIIENEIDGCDVFDCKMCERDCTCDNSPCVEEGCQLAIAVDTVLQELDRLQKENEKLKEIDLTTVHIKGVCDEKERWRNKIREKIEEIKEEDLELRETDSEGDIVTKCEQRAVLNILQDLLREE